MSVSVRLTALVLVSCPLWAAAQGTPCDRGLWETPFQHDTTGFGHPPDPSPSFGTIINAVHMALIPKGPHQGDILVWHYDRRHYEGAPWDQECSIIDVSGEQPVFTNFDLGMPGGRGDLFCSAHAWTPDGNLFVAGGTQYHSRVTTHADVNHKPASQGAGTFGGGNFGGIVPVNKPLGDQGARLAYLYDPAVGETGQWTRLQDMVIDRYYPSVIQTADDKMLVVGGQRNANRFPVNHYESFDLVTGEWEVLGGRRVFPGPPGPDPVLVYPRLHLLSTGDVFMAGFTGQTSRLNHAAGPGTWTLTGRRFADFTFYNSTFLLPEIYEGRDKIMAIGGEILQDGKWQGATDRVQIADGAADVGEGGEGGAWEDVDGLNQKRQRVSATILPDSSLLLIGGRDLNPGQDAGDHLGTPELYDPVERVWKDMAWVLSPRSYHATSALLPDGRVFVGGGDVRFFDYQIFVPPYLLCGRPRPVITAAPQAMTYSETPLNYRIQVEPLPGGVSIERAVLMSPASVTHHQDFQVRQVELEIVSSGEDDMTIRAPQRPALAPRGYYMLFLLTDLGTPSVASWVKLQ